MRISWDEMFNKSVIEFLNIASYCHDRSELEKWQMKEWEKKQKMK